MRGALAGALALAFAAGAGGAQAAPAIHVLNVQLPVTDLDATSKFYQQALGMQEVLRLGTTTKEVILGFGSTVAEAKANPAARVQLIAYAKPAVVYDHSNMVLEVADTAALVTRITNLGGTVVSAPHEATIEGQKKVLALVKDPAGNIFELISNK